MAKTIAFVALFYIVSCGSEHARFHLRSSRLRVKASKPHNEGVVRSFATRHKEHTLSPEKPEDAPASRRSYSKRAVDVGRSAGRKSAEAARRAYQEEKAAEAHAKRLFDEHLKKPIMSKINVIRTEMCWRRPNLLQHVKCMKFLGLHCKKASTSLGICQEFKEKVSEACMDNLDHDTTDEKTMRIHEVQCEVAHDLTGEAHDHGDADGDGVPNAEDKFPTDKHEQGDIDGDGIGDNADPDRDGDGVLNKDDKFPDDPKEQTDSDGDGIGDNSDHDSDNDGYDDHVDAFPDDSNEWHDMDGDGIGDNSDPDRDGDGVNNDEDSHPDDPTRHGRGGADGFAPAPAGAGKTGDMDGDGVLDEEDAFPYDPKEDKDSDGDGMGDNSDAFPQDPHEWADSDGDGVGDSADVFPDDAKESVDFDNDGVGDNSDHFPEDPNEQFDSDGDGVGDKTDAFPHDPTEQVDTDKDRFGDNQDVFPDDGSEWADSDGDGVGDNADMYPHDPNCHSDPCELVGGGFAPSAIPHDHTLAGGPGLGVRAPAAPGAAPAHFGATTAYGANPHTAAHLIKPWHLNKVNRPLPDQGYDEQSFSKHAMHLDGSTFTRDWGAEWPLQINNEDEEKSIRSACQINPNNRWCERYAVHGEFAR